MKRGILHKNRPILSRRAFWDTDLDTLDFDRYDRFIITRVFERGTEADQRALIGFYGPGKLRRTLTNAPDLQPIGREWAKRQLHLSDSDFACSTQTPHGRNFSRY